MQLSMPGKWIPRSLLLSLSLPLQLTLPLDSTESKHPYLPSIFGHVFSFFQIPPLRATEMVHERTAPCWHGGLNKCRIRRRPLG